jgi:peptidoglycan-associated lipoprotein
MKHIFSAVCAIVLLASCTACGHRVKGSGVNVITPTTSENMVYEKELINLGDRVFFTINSSLLSKESKDLLKQQADFIKDSKKGLTFTIEGHCDERGTTEYNLALGERRADSVKRFLMNQGISGSKISIVSYGKEKPVALGHDELAWQQNRRAVTVVN